MSQQSDKAVATLKSVLSEGNVEQMRGAAQTLLGQYERQSRQLGRLVKLADAKTERLMATNETLTTLTGNLSRFIPKTVVDRLINPDDQKITRKDRREITVFFSDIVGFTSMTEQLEPEQLSTLLADYFSEMNQLCERWGGTLDQFIGDAIVIFFGAPETKGAEIDAQNAVGMALEMQEHLHALRVKWSDMGLSIPLHVRVGIATGYATVGNFGSDRRMHYTAIGNGVNEAARIQSLCTPDRVYVGADTYLPVRDSFSARLREITTLKGQKTPTKLYEINPSQRQRTPDLIDGSGDGFRIFVDTDIIEDRQVALRLLKKAVAQLESYEEPSKNDTQISQTI